ncbi:MAG: SipW-dependent-type signal peptide-containing protein [bacterium]|nr:SipW-dependent-type signal peptide-containing protein [bacterium]
MKKILLSLGMISVVAVLAIGATGAFFSDTETSTGNTFTAGAVDLTVDSQQHYNGMVCTLGTNQIYTWQPEINTLPPYYPAQDSPCDGTWTATNLGAQHQFFDFADVKPGDSGENTLSLHVDNDAWLRLVISLVTDLDNSCTEPEEGTNSESCTVSVPEGTTAGAGELRENLLFSVWLDEGQTVGFQNNGDLGEGDNIRNYAEPIIISSGTIDENGEIWNLSDAGGLYLIGGQTAYFGIDWNLPNTVGNDTQTDSMSATVEFQVEQHRNNPTPSWI